MTDDVEIGIEQARKQIGDLADRARYAGQTTYLTRHGRRIAAIVPLEATMPAPTLPAAMTTVVVDVEDTRQDGDTHYTPGWIIPAGATLDTDLWGCGELDSDTDADSVGIPTTADENRWNDAADQALAVAGWRRTGDWTPARDLPGNTVTAPLVPAAYKAMMGTTADTVQGDHYDVQINDWREDGPGPEALAATDTDVRIDDPDGNQKCETAADQVLAAHGWVRTGGWEWDDGSTVYATVERTTAVVDHA